MHLLPYLYNENFSVLHRITAENKWEKDCDHSLGTAKHWKCKTAFIWIRWLSGKESLPANAGDTGLISGSWRFLGEGNGSHSGILAWKIPWTEEPGRLQSMGLQRVRHDWVTEHMNGLKAGLENSVSYWAPEIFECVCLFVVRMKQFYMKSSALNFIMSKTSLRLLSPLFLAPEALYMVSFFISSQLQAVRAETVLCNKVCRVLLRISWQPYCLPRQSIFQSGLLLGGDCQLLNNRISFGRPKDRSFEWLRANRSQGGAFSSVQSLIVLSSFVI